MDSSRTDLFLMCGYLQVDSAQTTTKKHKQKLRNHKQGKESRRIQHNKITLLHAKKIMFGRNLK